VALGSKIVSLGRIYATSENYFPLGNQLTALHVLLSTEWAENGPFLNVLTLVYDYIEMCFIS